MQKPYVFLNKNFLNLIDFLIRQPDATSIRDNMIKLAGTKEYLRLKLEKGIELN